MAVNSGDTTSGWRYNDAAKDTSMRYILVSVFMLASTIFVGAQGSCTEAVVKQGNLPMADDASSYMPPFGKPVSGKAAIPDTAEKKFAGRTNVRPLCYR